MVTRFEKRIWIAVGVVVFLVIAWFCLPASQYTTEAFIQVMHEEPRVIFNTNEPRMPYEVFQQTQKALLKSRMVLGAVVTNPKIASLLTVREARQSWKDPIDWLEKVLVVDFPPGSEILRISLSGERPQDLAEIVNAITDTYMNLVVDESYTERVKRLEDLRKLWDTYQQDLKAKRAKVRALSKAVGSDDRRALAKNQQFARRWLEVAEETDLNLELKQMELQIEKAAVEAKLERRKNKEGPKDEARIADMEEQLAALTAQEAAIKSARAERRTQWPKHFEEGNSLSETTIDLQTEEDEIALLSETAEKIGREVEIADVELKAPKRFKVIDRAKVPQVSTKFRVADNFRRDWPL